MEGSCSTGQSPQWAVVPVEEEVSSVAVKYRLVHFFHMSVKVKLPLLHSLPNAVHLVLTNYRVQPSCIHCTHGVGIFPHYLLCAVE
jgi:hypothetical protein